MAIVKMKRLRLMGMRSERESLLHLLQKLGCVEVDEPAIDLSDPQWAAVGKPDGQGLATAREQSNLLNQALNVLARHVSLKGGLLRPRPRLSRKELFDQDSYRRGLDTAQAIVDGERELADGQADLDEGWAEYNDGLAELEDARQTLAEETADAQLELSDALAQLQDGEAEYRDGLQEYREGEAEAQEQIADAQKELEQARRDIAEIEACQWYLLDRNTNAGYVSYSMDADRMGNLATVFPLIFFLVAALVCLTTMTRMVEEQRVTIGGLKALGYSKGAIAVKYVGYGFLASALGSLIGLAVGLTLLPWIICNAWNIIYTLGEVQYGLEPVTSSLACLAAVGTVTLSALGACFSTLTAVPAQLMRPKAPPAGKRVLLERVPGLWRRLWSTSLTMRGCSLYCLLELEWLASTTAAGKESPRFWYSSHRRIKSS